jgi:DNA recombination protein RmuC
MLSLMPPELYLLAALLVLGFAGLAWFFHRQLKSLRDSQKLDNTLTQWLNSMQTSVTENTRQVNTRLDHAAKVISDVQRNLGEMSEVGRGIKSLQEFLQSPKLRGGIGEQVLQEMIGQTFPKNAFHLQYAFKSGVKVDAVLKTDAGLLCIDSKFPMENFTALVKGEPGAKKTFVSDIRKHITAIAQKYILPDEGTMDFALMYIPSESVYYEVVNIPELSEHARRLRVYSVSPNTLYAHLQVLLQSLQGKELEAKSRQVFQLLRATQRDYEKITGHLSTLGSHLSNAYNKFSDVSHSFTLLGQKLSSTSQLSTSETKQLE